MGSKSVRLDERVYAIIEAHKREDETYSEAIERLVGGPSLLELAGILSADESTAFREGIDRSRAADAAGTDELVERFERRE